MLLAQFMQKNWCLHLCELAGGSVAGRWAVLLSAFELEERPGQPARIYMSSFQVPKLMQRNPTFATQAGVDFREVRLSGGSRMSVCAIVSCQADKIRTVRNRSKSPGLLGMICVQNAKPSSGSFSTNKSKGESPVFIAKLFEWLKQLKNETWSESCCVWNCSLL